MSLVPAGRAELVRVHALEARLEHVDEAGKVSHLPR